MSGTNRRRIAVVGTGARFGMFAEEIAVEHCDRWEIVGLCDSNQNVTISPEENSLRNVNRGDRTPVELFQRYCGEIAHFVHIGKIGPD